MTGCIKTQFRHFVTHDRIQHPSPLELTPHKLWGGILVQEEPFLGVLVLLCHCLSSLPCLPSRKCWKNNLRHIWVFPFYWVTFDISWIITPLNIITQSQMSCVLYWSHRLFNTSPISPFHPSPNPFHLHSFIHLTNNLLGNRVKQPLVDWNIKHPIIFYNSAFSPYAS